MSGKPGCEGIDLCCVGTGPMPDVQALESEWHCSPLSLSTVNRRPSTICHKPSAISYLLFPYVNRIAENPPARAAVVFEVDLHPEHACLPRRHDVRGVALVVPAGDDLPVPQQAQAGPPRRPDLQRHAS